nr:GNAT family N-acetyltransferase [Pseudoroseomonas ludipueritiae]
MYHRADGPYPCRYDPGHPDEDDPANHPLVLMAGDTVVGTIRIDMKPDGRAVFRLIAVDPAWRGAGLGAALLRQAEAYAEKHGASSLCVNARQPAMGFYARSGFIPCAWDGNSQCAEAIAMVKPLRKLPMAARRARQPARLVQAA